MEAMHKLIELMKTAESKFVRLNAARSVLLCGLPETPQRSTRFKHIGPRGVSPVEVTITKFRQEDKGGSE